jgi:autotransporter-associated beta strand protein
MKTQSCLPRITAGLALCALMPFCLNTAQAMMTPVWTNLNGGSWPVAANWMYGNVGQGSNGVPADFSELTLPADETVTLDGAITIGYLTFGDMGNAHTWTVNTGTGGTLTLIAPVVTPSITVNNQTTIINATLAGTQGFIKAGKGTLALTAENTITGGTTVNAGTLFADAGNTASGAVGGGNVTVNNGGTISVGGDNSFVGGSPLDSSTITINTGGVIISTNGSSCHLSALLLNGGTLSATTWDDLYGNWNFDYGVSTPGNGSSSFITGGNAVLTQEGGTVFNVGASDTLTVSTVLEDTDNIRSDQGLIKNGSGTLALTGANAYSGGTTVNAGTLYADAYDALGGGNVTVNNGGTISVGWGDNSLVGWDPMSSSTTTINTGGVIISTNGYTCNLQPVVLSGGTLSATTENPDYGNWNFDYGVSTPGNGSSSFITGGNAALTQGGGTVFNIGANDTLTVSTALAETLQAADYGLIKSGSGTLTLTGANTSTAQWTVAAGTLNGTGAIAAPVVVQSGGTLAAGTASSIGTLYISSSLTLAGNVNLRINSSTSTNDLLSQMNGVAFGGTLTVTDLGSSLALGNTFTLFKISGGAYSGGFTNFTLPALPAGLIWDLSQLPVNGSITITNAAGTPIFSPSPGFYFGVQPVTISSLTPGATIFYTTNGATPSTGSLSGIAPVTVTVPVNTTMTIRAYAQTNGYNNSAVVTGIYTTVAEAVWTDLNGGSWPVAGNWTNDLVGQGSGITADFSRLTLPGNETVTLDGTITIGQLIFGDKGSNYSWELDPGNGGTLTLAATNTPTITVSNQSAIITATIAGTNGLAMIGPGTLTLSAQNTYTGGTTIGSGTIATTDFATLGTGPINIGANGTYSFTTDGGNQPTFANAVSGSGAFNAQGSPDNQSFWSGDWSGFSGTFTIGAEDTGWWAESANTGSTTMKINMVAGTTNEYSPYGSFLGLYDKESNITRTYNIGELTGGTGALIWGQPGKTNNITLSVGALGTSTTYAGVIVNSWNNPTDTTSTINLTKVGAGTLTLSGINTYTGVTIVSNGTLEVDGAIGTGAVTVQSGGTLDGAGMIEGTVTVNGGGTMAVGTNSAIGNLTIANTLTLNAGSTTKLRLNQAAATNDSVSGITTLTYGGTLTVTNLGGTLAAGNSFHLINASTCAGNFAATNLPALGSGLAWNWTPTNGTLAVVSTVPPPPTITSFSHLTNGSFSLTFTGTSGAGYTLYTTTNLALPISSWTVLTNGLFNGTPVTYQDTHATNYRARFYTLMNSTVFPAPTITGFSHQANGSFSLTFTGTSGAGYTLYATTNLALPISSWTVVTNGLFNGTPVTFQDANATNYRARFYRVALP